MRAGRKEQEVDFARTHRWAPHFRRFSSFHIANSDKKSEIANKGFVLKRFLPTKQVSFRKRVLILFDWMKTRVFGRHTSIFSHTYTIVVLAVVVSFIGGVVRSPRRSHS